jgi:hypothetical protein
MMGVVCRLIPSSHGAEKPLDWNILTCQPTGYLLNLKERKMGTFPICQWIMFLKKS